MTQEQKAKAYDEALEYAHYLIDECCKEGTNGSFHRADLQKMFPELKESEDERIRKALITFFQRFPYGSIGEAGTNVKEVLAWLEKQGEQGPYGQREECLDCQVNYAGDCKGSCAMKKGEQKPTWSEEDESRMDNLFHFLEEYGSQYYGHLTLQDTIYWLKSLKDRVQPHQEWSEEDIRNMENIDSVLFYDKDLPEDTCVRLRNWLKSLRPQNRWKPTDEQMTQLKRYCSDNRPLTSLYELLKKLREE